MASNNMLPIAAEQPTEGGLDVLTMSGAEIKHQISATHVPPEKDFDAKSLFDVVDQILRVEKDPYILKEGATIDSLDLTLSTDQQLVSEMAHKASDVETAHRTAMSILNKLSNYSWQTKAVLALANFALDYKKYILATSPGDPSTRVIESVEIPAYVTTFYHKEEIEEMIDLMGATTACILYLEKQKSSFFSHAMDGIPVLVYWIIMSVVACTTPMFCLTGNEENTQEVLSLAKSIYYKLDEQFMAVRCPKKLKAMRRVKEFLQTADEVTEVLKALIFGKDDVQPLIDRCVDEPVSLNVLKNKGVLLFLSDLHVSRDDILIMKPIYEEITDYNIVWIPIVVQWTDELRTKFDILRSQMPWYVLPYFSQLAGIKFIKEEWHFENDPVVVAMDARGNIQGENVLPEIRMMGTRGFLTGGSGLKLCVTRPPGPHTMPWNVPPYFSQFAGIKFMHFEDHPIVVNMDALGKDGNVSPHIGMIGTRAFLIGLKAWKACVASTSGPHTMEYYSFYCGGKDSSWIEQFFVKGNAMADDPIIREARISMEFSRVEEDNKWNLRRRGSKTRENEEIQRILTPFKKKERWAVLIKLPNEVVSGDGPKILEFLEMFDEWKQHVSRGFDNCFREYHERLSSTNPSASTSQSV